MAMPTRQNDEPSPEPARQEVKQVDDWRRKLHWSASGHGWFAITEEGTLFVSEETYERHMKAYLASEGITWKAWTEIMRPAQEAWQRQCEAEARLQANLGYWLNLHERGVSMFPGSD